MSQGPNSRMELIGGIEMGGTKMICGVARDSSSLLSHIEIPTGKPATTIQSILRYFSQATEVLGPIGKIGIGSFGPVDLSPDSTRYGELVHTPKSGWSGVNMPRQIEQALNVNCIVDTDVNCALRAELNSRGVQGTKNAAYVTVGTGIGVAFCIDGSLQNGASHPEFGHCYIPRHKEDTAFQGNCPYHGANCAEGLVSGSAIAARTGKPATELDEHDPVWFLVSDYLAALCVNIFYASAPSMIILGGGVMNRHNLIKEVHTAFLQKLNGYSGALSHRVGDDGYIRPVGLGGDAGLVGALMLVEERLLVR